MGSEIQRAAEALENVRKQIDAHLGVDVDTDLELKKGQEFIEIGLPRYVARHLDTGRAKAAITSHLRTSARRQESVPSLEVAGRSLKLGPETEGTIDAVRRFLDEETSEAAKDALLATSPYERLSWIPIFMAALLVVTWAFPLRRWTILMFAFLLLALMGLAVTPARDVGWRTTLRQSRTIAALGFFGIGVFGIAYSVCALVSEEALGHVTRLGYPFLVSTGLGVAGGLLGDNPRGAALVIAHIQLLLFLGGLIGVVATLLRIERAVRQRG